MPKEYRTIEEVSGPLMLVKNTSGVTYNELGEIELSDGSRRRCRVLEINGSDALVQLFESSAGINIYFQNIAASVQKLIPENPEKIIASSPAAIRVRGNPLKALGGSANSILARTPAKTTIARVKPTPAANP